MPRHSTVLSIVGTLHLGAIQLICSGLRVLSLLPIIAQMAGKTGRLARGYPILKTARRAAACQLRRTASSVHVDPHSHMETHAYRRATREPLYQIHSRVTMASSRALLRARRYSAIQTTMSSQIRAWCVVADHPELRVMMRQDPTLRVGARWMSACPLGNAWRVTPDQLAPLETTLRDPAPRAWRHCAVKTNGCPPTHVSNAPRDPRVPPEISPRDPTPHARQHCVVRTSGCTSTHVWRVLWDLPALLVMTPPDLTQSAPFLSKPSLLPRTFPPHQLQNRRSLLHPLSYQRRLFRLPHSSSTRSRARRRASARATRRRWR